MRMAGPENMFPLAPSPLLTPKFREIVRGVTSNWDKIVDERKKRTSFLTEVRRECSKQAEHIPRGGELELLIKCLGLPLDVQETEGGGNCGPAAAIDQLRSLGDISDNERLILHTVPSKDRQMQLRFHISTIMKTSNEEYVQIYRRRYEEIDHLASLTPGAPRWDSFDAMWTGMGKNGVYVEEGFWTATALILQRDIHLVSLFSHPNRPFQTFSGNRTSEHLLQEDRLPLFIGYLPPRHYVSLKPQPFAGTSMLDIVRARKLLEQGGEQINHEAIEHPLEEGGHAAAAEQEQEHEHGGQEMPGELNSR